MIVYIPARDSHRAAEQQSVAIRHHRDCERSSPITLVEWRVRVRPGRRGIAPLRDVIGKADAAAHAAILPVPLAATHALPVLRKSNSGMPSRRALSARLSVTPEPGKTTTPIGSASSIWSLRLNGAALTCCTQSGLKTICGTLREIRQQAAIFSAPRGLPPCSSACGARAWTRSSAA